MVTKVSYAPTQNSATIECQEVPVQQTKIHKVELGFNPSTAAIAAAVAIFSPPGTIKDAAQGTADFFFRPAIPGTADSASPFRLVLRDGYENTLKPAFSATKEFFSPVRANSLIYGETVSPSPFRQMLTSTYESVAHHFRPTSTWFGFRKGPSPFTETVTYPFKPMPTWYGLSQEPSPVSQVTTPIYQTAKDVANFGYDQVAYYFRPVRDPYWLGLFQRPSPASELITSIGQQTAEAATQVKDVLATGANAVRDTAYDAGAVVINTAVVTPALAVKEGISNGFNSYVTSPTIALKDGLSNAGAAAIDCFRPVVTPGGLIYGETVAPSPAYQMISSAAGAVASPLITAKDAIHNAGVKVMISGAEQANVAKDIIQYGAQATFNVVATPFVAAKNAGETAIAFFQPEVTPGIFFENVGPSQFNQMLSSASGKAASAAGALASPVITAKDAIQGAAETTYNVAATPFVAAKDAGAAAIGFFRPVVTPGIFGENVTPSPAYQMISSAANGAYNAGASAVEVVANGVSSAGTSVISRITAETGLSFLGHSVTYLDAGLAFTAAAVTGVGLAILSRRETEKKA